VQKRQILPGRLLEFILFILFILSKRLVPVAVKPRLFAVNRGYLHLGTKRRRQRIAVTGTL
jgi:hypothetical protein